MLLVGETNPSSSWPWRRRTAAINAGATQPWTASTWSNAPSSPAMQREQSVAHASQPHESRQSIGAHLPDEETALETPFSDGDRPYLRRGAHGRADEFRRRRGCATAVSYRATEHRARIAGHAQSARRQLNLQSRSHALGVIYVDRLPAAYTHAGGGGFAFLVSDGSLRLPARRECPRCTLCAVRTAVRSPQPACSHATSAW